MPAFPAIVHLDADAFFVSCEQALDPSLRGKRCAVGGRERGIISSASYEARACGVYTPMPSARALKVCPDLILIRHTSGLYGRISRRMFDLCETLTPYVQRNSIDEGYLDLSPCGLRSAGEIEAEVKRLQALLWKELQIPVSMGIAANRLVAQIASKLRKPRGFVVVLPGEEESFLAPLPVGRLPGIGAKTEAALRGLGIERVGDLVLKSGRELAPVLGSRWQSVVESARGLDDSPVESDSGDAKSYSQQETFESDISDAPTIERIAKRMLDELMSKVRHDGKRVRTLTVRLRYPDFTHDSRACSLEAATDVEGPFIPLIAPLLASAWKRRAPLRLVSVKLSGVGDGSGQLELFAEGEERRRRLARTVDRLKGRDGQPMVTHGHQLREKQARLPGKKKN